MKVDMARKHATCQQTVQADKRRKPPLQPFKPASRVLVIGRPYTACPGRSKKLEPRWFGPFKVLAHDEDTNNNKLELPSHMAREKPYFHISSFNAYNENDPDRFTSRRMDKPASIRIDNAEEWEAEQILDYRRLNNTDEFLVHWQGYERADDSWEPIQNLDYALELIQEYRDQNHPNQPTPKITSPSIKTSWEPIEVFSTPCTATAIPDGFWEPYDYGEYDSSSSEADYFPTSDDELLWHRDMDEIDYED